MKALRLEENLGKAYSRSKRAKDLEGWKQAQQAVEALSGDYAKAVREWYVKVDVQISHELSHLHQSGRAVYRSLKRPA